MDNADRKGTAKQALQKLGLPTVAGVLGAGAGLILTRTRKPSGGVSSLKDGVGDLFDDLRQKLESVTGKVGSSSGAGASTGGNARAATLSPDDLAERRRVRGERRQQRRSRSRR